MSLMEMSGVGRGGVEQSRFIGEQGDLGTCLNLLLTTRNLV